MTMKNSLYLLSTILLFSTSIACTPRSANSTQDVSLSTSKNSVAQASTTKAKQSRPGTKTETISVEGEKQQVSLKLFSDPVVPFTTYFPADFIVDRGGSDEGTGVRFTSKINGATNEKAYVHAFLPAKPPNVARMKTVVTGARGLLATNKWKIVSRTNKVNYPWAKEKIVFEQRAAGQNLTGNVIIGENKGKAFYVITHYPAEYGDGFEPRANLILKNMQFKQ